MTSRSQYAASRDYEERVYAGVLGKIIGVYLGRPFEQWSHERIERELGEVTYYVHEKLGQPLIVTDDDISGTFTFVRALMENGNDPNLTPAQIGDWWLNTIVENRTILWWGGMGHSTEHTAYLRLKQGYRAPESGSIALNGVAVAEEIGAQIFIDGWGMICPGDPERAADFARRAGSVSHDGEAIYGAQVIAAMEALAFVEPDLGKLLDTAVSLIPNGSLIAELIGSMREWASAHGDDWRATLGKIHEVYPYSRFGTNCPMVSNHAVVLLGLLHGNDDFQRSLMITNTAGYDTDCNSANVGCLLGIKNGLDSIDAKADWRGPVADRLYLPTADGGRSITDALRETYEMVNMGRALEGLTPVLPKDGARFHFSLPGSVQGFQAENDDVATISNWGGMLAVSFRGVTAERPARVSTATFVPPDALKHGGYSLVASPTLYSGQVVTSRIKAVGDVKAAIFAGVYNGTNTLTIIRGEETNLADGQWETLSWTVPDTEGQPITMAGIEIISHTPMNGSVLVDWLTWSEAPAVSFRRPSEGTVWKRAWVNAADHFDVDGLPAGQTYRIIQNHGTGIVTQGETTWTGYTASTKISPRLSSRAGLLACVHGLTRYVALLLDHDRHVRLVEQHDREQRVLAEWEAVWEFGGHYEASITITAAGISAAFNGAVIEAAPSRYKDGAVGMLVDTGFAEFGPVDVRAIG